MTATHSDHNVEVREVADRCSIDDDLVDRLMDQIDRDGLELLGPDGVLTELTSRIMNRALEAEMSDHLGYEKGDRAGRGSGNNRNGTYPKTVLTDAGGIGIDVPRDRNGQFEPRLVPTGSRRIAGFDEMIIGLVSRGMTTRDVRSQVADMYQVDISPELVSRITDGVFDELRQWRDRPLDEVYPIMYLDAIVVKVRDGHSVVNRPVYIALGVDVDGRKHVLGLWLGKGDEGAKFWLAVLTELKTRGVKDVLIACCDGLTGFGDAIETVWPRTVVQTCVVHLIRNAIRFVSWKDRKPVVAALKPIYRASNAQTAADALDEFELEWGDRYPAVVDLWRRNWDRFIPFLEFDAEIRKIIYTTNAIESMNYQLRKVTKTRGSFPDRRRRLQDLLPRDPQYRPSTRRRTRNRHQRMETSTQRVRDRFPRTYRPDQIEQESRLSHTNNLTSSQLSDSGAPLCRETELGSYSTQSNPAETRRAPMMLSQQLVEALPLTRIDQSNRQTRRNRTIAKPRHPRICTSRSGNNASTDNESAGHSPPTARTKWPCPEAQEHYNQAINSYPV